MAKTERKPRRRAIRRAIRKARRRTIRSKFSYPPEKAGKLFPAFFVSPECSEGLSCRPSGLGLLTEFSVGDFLVHYRHVEFPALGDDLLERGTRKRARLREENYLLAEKHQGRDRADIERRGEVLLFVGVHFSKNDVGVLFRTSLEYRREALARPAPGRPEIDEDHVVAVHDLLEIVLGQRDRCHARISGIRREPRL